MNTCGISNVGYLHEGSFFLSINLDDLSIVENDSKRQPREPARRSETSRSQLATDLANKKINYKTVNFYHRSFFQ